jgi:cobalamin biosynthesis Mg chelatase CobN
MAQIIPLEEHFENFTEVTGDIIENFAGEETADFLGLGKKARARKAARQAVKNEKKQAKADTIRAKGQAQIIRAQGEADALRLSSQQTAQTNQLAAATGSAPASVEQSPMYQSLPETASRQAPMETTQAQTVSNQAPAPAPAKNNKTMYIIIAVVVIAAVVFLMKKKK